MEYNWFKIFNLTDFNALDLTSKEYVLNLEGIGQKSILVTKGKTVSLTYEGIMLAIELNNKNPFEFDDHAIYLDDSNDVYLGLPVEE